MERPLRQRLDPDAWRAGGGEDEESEVGAHRESLPLGERFGNRVSRATVKSRANSLLGLPARYFGAIATSPMTITLATPPSPAQAACGAP